MIIGSADINLTKNSLSAAEALDAAENAQETADKAILDNDTSWYLQSVALTSANGKNKNFYGNKEPENPVEGDLWFTYDENGNLIDMKRYKDGKWVAEVDLTDAKDKLKQAEEIAKRMESNTSKFDSLFSSAAELWKDSDVQSGRISSVKASVDGLQASVTNLSNSTSSQITQLSNQLNLKVSKGSVISQINLEADSAYISSKAIILDGDTTVRGNFYVPSAQITGKLSASQISVSQLSALTADLGTVVAGTIRGVEITGSTIKSTNGSSDITMSNGLLKFSGSGTKFTSIQDSSVDIWESTLFSGQQWSKLRPGSITFSSVSNDGYASTTTTYDRNTINASNHSFEISSSSLQLPNPTYIGNSVYITNASIGVGGTFNGSSSTSNVSIGSSNIYVPGKVYASGSALTSDRDKKKNITPYQKEALPEINSTQIYTYNLKTELDDEFPHLGIVLQEAPVDIVDPIGGVELYAMTSLAWKAIQELSLQNESLKQRIVILEGGV